MKFLKYRERHAVSLRHRVFVNCLLMMYIYIICVSLTFIHLTATFK